MERKINENNVSTNEQKQPPSDSVESIVDELNLENDPDLAKYFNNSKLINKDLSK